MYWLYLLGVGKAGGEMLDTLKVLGKKSRMRTVFVLLLSLWVVACGEAGAGITRCADIQNNSDLVLS